MFGLISVLGSLAPEISEVDAEARLTREEGINYRALVTARVAPIAGFEPD
jgi:hypothetical protein